MAKRTNKLDTTNAALVTAYAVRYATNVGLRAVFPRLCVGMMAELQGWPVRNADGGANVAHFTTVEAAEAAIQGARRDFREAFSADWSATG